MLETKLYGCHKNLDKTTVIIARTGLTVKHVCQEEQEAVDPSPVVPWTGSVPLYKNSYSKKSDFSWK